MNLNRCPKLLDQITTAPFGCSSTGWFEACSCKPTSEGLLPSLVQQLDFVYTLLDLEYARQPIILSPPLHVA